MSPPSGCDCEWFSIMLQHRTVCMDGATIGGIASTEAEYCKQGITCAMLICIVFACRCSCSCCCRRSTRHIVPTILEHEPAAATARAFTRSSAHVSVHEAAVEAAATAHRQQKRKLGIAEREESAQVMLRLLLLLPEARYSNAGAMEATALQSP